MWTEKYKTIYKLIESFDTIVIARHVGVDPDAMSSQLALRDSILKTFPNKTVLAVGSGSVKFTYLGKLDKLKEPSSYLQEFNYQILRSNIDVNQHMHNLYYLDLAYETLPESVYQTANFSHVEIMYKRECKLGDHITCLYSFENGQHIITIKSEDEKQLHAIIQLS